MRRIVNLYEPETSICARGVPIFEGRQPQFISGINREHPLGRNDWRLLWLPHPIFPRLGSVKSDPTLAGSSVYGISERGRSLITPTSGNSAGATWSDAALQLDINSGIAVVKRTDTEGKFTPILTTRRVGFLGTSGFRIYLTAGGNVRISRHEYADILTSSNAVGLEWAYIAWSYNASTGDAAVALNGTLTTGNSAQSFLHADFNIGEYANDSSANNGTSIIALIGFSATEVKNTNALVVTSRNPWQIFE